MKRPCRACGQREATGYIFELCDPCFDAFEAKVSDPKNQNAEGKYEPTGVEVEAINEPFIDRSKGN